MPDILSLGLFSIAIGFLGSLVGLGGATILVPLLVFFGIPVKEAIASSMVSIIAVSSGSASAYVRERIANVKIAMFLEMFTISGAIFGATITTYISPVFLYFFFAAFLATSFINIKKLRNEYVPEKNPDKVSRFFDLKGSYYDKAKQQVVNYHATNAVTGGFGMMIAGIAAGMLGIGAGAFKVTVQENILKLPPKVSTSTSNFIIGMTALAATSVYLFSGFLNISLMAPIAVGSTIGSVIGGRVMNRLNDVTVRILFYIIIIFLIAQMLMKGVTSI